MNKMLLCFKAKEQVNFSKDNLELQGSEWRPFKLGMHIHQEVPQREKGSAKDHHKGEGENYFPHLQFLGARMRPSGILAPEPAARYWENWQEVHPICCQMRLYRIWGCTPQGPTNCCQLLEELSGVFLSLVIFGSGSGSGEGSIICTLFGDASRIPGIVQY